MSMHIRSMVPDDLPDARSLAVASGLPAAAEFLPHYLRWQPDGYLVGRDDDGKLLAMVGAQRYGPVAFIGAMGVRPELQRQGLGQRILGHLLAVLDATGVTTCWLEATPSGRGLYEKLGFLAEHTTEVMRRTTPPATRTARNVEPMR